MRSDTRRLFLGFEHRGGWLCVLALDGAGVVRLRATFPLCDTRDLDLESGPAAAIAQTLEAFVRAHDAQPACGTDHAPPVLEALAEYLNGSIRYVDLCELERVALPGHDPLVRRELGIDAHHRALLAGLAAATEGGF
jgi:hypothetical protein